MNAGVDHSTADVLLFLHADTLVGSGSRLAIEKAIQTGAAGGCFLRYFRPETRRLHALSWLAAWRAWGLGIAYGDQGLWIRRDVFDALGHFPLQDTFEDVELALGISTQGPFEVLRPAISTSARRFEKRPGQLMDDARLTWRYYINRIRGT